MAFQAHKSEVRDLETTHSGPHPSPRFPTMDAPEVEHERMQGEKAVARGNMDKQYFLRVLLQPSTTHKSDT